MATPLPPLNLRPSADYPFAMELPDLKDDPYLKVLRPLVETYLAFELTSSRHIKSLRLTPSQFDVIATLGDTEGMTCSELSAHTLVTKGTLTGVLDRLVAKGLIRRDSVKGDRRCVKIRLTEKGYIDLFLVQRPFEERPDKGNVRGKRIAEHRVALFSQSDFDTAAIAFHGVPSNESLRHESIEDAC